MSASHSHQLSLPACPRTHCCEAVGRAGHLRVRLGGQAVVGEPALAVLAEPAGDVEWQDHPLADLHLVDAIADLNDLAQVLVAEPAAGFEVGPALIHMQVRAADVGGGDPHENVGRTFDLRVGDLAS